MSVSRVTPSLVSHVAADQSELLIQSANCTDSIGSKTNYALTTYNVNLFVWMMKHLVQHPYNMYICVY